jgi:hypothetical protein
MSRAARPLKDGQREAKEIACLNVTALRLAEFAQVLEASRFVDVTLAALAAAYRKQQFFRFPMPGLFQVQDGRIDLIAMSSAASALGHFLASDS